MSEQLAAVLKNLDQTVDWADKLKTLEQAEGIDEETKKLLIWATQYDRQLSATVSGEPNFEIEE